MNDHTVLNPPPSAPPPPPTPPLPLQISEGNWSKFAPTICWLLAFHNSLHCWKVPSVMPTDHFPQSSSSHKKYWKMLTTNTYTDAKTNTNTKGALKHSHWPASKDVLVIKSSIIKASNAENRKQFVMLVAQFFIFCVCILQWFTVCGIAIFEEVAFDKHLSLVTRGCHDEHFTRVSQPP